MGAPKRWIKTLLGLKKSGKTQFSDKEEKNENTSVSASEVSHPMETSAHNNTVETENRDVIKENKDAEVVGDENSQSVSGSASLSSTSSRVQNASQYKLREELAALHIQTAMRRYLSSVSAAKICNKRKPSVAFASQHELNENANVLTKTEDEDAIDANFPSISESANLPSTSLQVRKAAWIPPNMSKEQAAIHIQTATRGFLARRSLRALRGLVRLQALVRGRAVRKQAAITLRCMQALVRVQARVRARRVRIILENQSAQQKIQQQLDNDARVKEIEAGWCDSTGSVEEIQAKVLKRKEAAAKREKAKAYALARQWQAGSRQQQRPAEFEPDRSNWGWNWLERWMAVRPWENNHLDFNLKDGFENEQPADSEGVPAVKSISRGKKPMSSNRAGKISRSRSKSSTSNEKKTNSHPDGYSSSPEVSSNVRERPNKPVSNSSSSKPVGKDSAKKATSRKTLGPRSRSNPKERSTAADKQGNKRLSLPATGHEQRAQPSRKPSQTAAKRTPNAPKPVRAKTKSNGTDVTPSKVSSQTTQ